MNDNDHLIWHTEQRKLGELIEWEKNPRKLSKHDAEQIRKSIAGFGFADPFIVNTNNHLIGGHQRKKVMLSDGYKLEDLVDVRIPSRELTEQEVAELAVRLNKNTGEWDFEILENHFSKIDLLNWGFTNDELKGLNFGDQLPEDPGPQLDKAEELRQKWGLESGQLWQLGEHRLLCGDSTKRENVERVMGAEKANMVVTDPPYGVEYDSKWRKPYSSGEYSVGTIENDNRADWSEVFRLFDAPILYIWHGGLHADIVATGLRSIGYELRAQIIWNKGVMVFGRGAYHWKHEPCWYAIKKGHKANWIGDHSQTTVWDCANNSGASRTGDELDNFHANHISQKPVQLFIRAINNHDAEIVADPFLGSGTTIIACQNLGRKCRAIEILPAYCAVAIQRWVDMTGKKPELVEA